jgi:hypothetical protein
VLALYEGTPSEEQRKSEILPRSVRVFQGNARRFAVDLDRVEEDLAHALSSEASDWLGLPTPEERAP